jgi:hypothetical protein
MGAPVAQLQYEIVNSMTLEMQKLNGTGRQPRLRAARLPPIKP